MGTRTPWGTSDHTVRVTRGITFYGTPSHGGYRVCPTLNATMPEHLRLADGWYEEDCDWARVVVAFPAHFKAEDLEHAEGTLRNWAPQAWEIQYGRALQPGESYVKDERAFYAAHAADWLVIAAWGDWAEGVPKGFVKVVATLGGKRGSGGLERSFLVPAEEYDRRDAGTAGRLSGFAFVIDLARHQEVK